MTLIDDYLSEQEKYEKIWRVYNCFDANFYEHVCFK